MPVRSSLLHSAGRGRGVRRLIATLFVAALALPGAADAQEPQAQFPPAHIDVVDGDATLDRDGDQLSADPGMPVVMGDRLSTGRGRLELLFPDGSVIDLDEFTDLSLESVTLLRLRAGRVRVTIPSGSGAALQIDTPNASAHIDGAGEYRVAVMGSPTYGQTELAVTRGYAELEGDRGSAKLRAGERSVAWPNDLPSRPTSFNSARVDAFEQWVLAQRDDRTGRSAQYLPPDLRLYGGTLDRYGTWGFEGGFGYVWYPTVAAGWRPYYSGYWASVGPYGWTWIGAERWAWPTHHYGRWGYVRSRWFWIPDRRWAPAWVSWGAAPGYVGWCPLGFDNRPLFDFSASLAFGSGWTVLPRERFGIHRAYADRYAVAPGRLPARSAFVPTAPPAGLPRSAARRADGTASPRNRAVPRYGPQDRGVPSARPPAAGGSIAGPGRSADEGTRRGGIDASRDPARRNPRATDRVPSARPPNGTPGRSRGDRREGGAIAVPRANGDTAAPPQRQFPFGDFRRTPDASEPAAPAPPRDGGPVDSVRPPRNPEQREAAPRDQPQQPPISAPPPPAAGARRPSRGDAGRGGTITARPAEPAPRTGGGDRGGSGQGQQGGRIQGQQGGRSDGRTHDPGSRRPR